MRLVSIASRRKQFSDPFVLFHVTPFNTHQNRLSLIRYSLVNYNIFIYNVLALGLHFKNGMGREWGILESRARATSMYSSQHGKHTPASSLDN